MQLVALSGDLDQLAACFQLGRRARVVLEEVDRLANVAVGLGPRLGALADLERRQLQPPLPHPGSRALERSRPFGRAARAPGPCALAGGGDGCRNIGRRRAGGARDEPFRIARVGRVKVLAVGPAVGADHHRHCQRQVAIDLVQGVLDLRADSGAPKLQHGLIGERGHAAGGASSTSSDSPCIVRKRNESLLVFSSSRRTR